MGQHAKDLIKQVRESGSVKKVIDKLIEQIGEEYDGSLIEWFDNYLFVIEFNDEATASNFVATNSQDFDDAGMTLAQDGVLVTCDLEEGAEVDEDTVTTYLESAISKAGVNVLTFDDSED